MNLNKTLEMKENYKINQGIFLQNYLYLKC